MSWVTLAGSAISLGFLHGLGGDHLMAIATLAIDGRSPGDGRRRVVRTAVQFAAGHALLLGVGTALAVTLGWALPVAVESGAETMGGVLLVALGSAALWSLWAGRAYGHVHGGQPGAPRWHVHFGGPRHHGRADHSLTLPTIMGAVFAVSSLRMLMLLTSFGGGLNAFALPALLALVALFGVGILLSMSLFGVVLARVLSLGAIERMGRGAGVLVAVASVLLGVYWLT